MATSEVTENGRGAARLLSVRSADLIWHEWPGDPHFSLFDKASGMTHLLSAVPVEILMMLAEGPLTEAELCTELAALADVAMNDAWRRTVEDSATGLHALGLVSYRQCD